MFGLCSTDRVKSNESVALEALDVLNDMIIRFGMHGLCVSVFFFCYFLSPYF